MEVDDLEGMYIPDDQAVLGTARKVLPIGRESDKMFRLLKCFRKIHLET